MSRRLCCHLWIMFLTRSVSSGDAISADTLPPHLPSPPPFPPGLFPAFHLNCSESCTNTTADQRRSSEQQRHHTLPVFPVTITRTTISQDRSVHPGPEKRMFDDGIVEVTLPPQVTPGGFGALFGLGHAVPVQHPVERQARVFSPATKHTLPMTTKSHNVPLTFSTTTPETSDFEIFNVSHANDELVRPTDFLHMTLNGTCDDIDTSQEATNQFVEALQRAAALFLSLPSSDQVHVWSITCGSLMVNYSLRSNQLPSFRVIQRQFLEANFSFVFGRKRYLAIALTRDGNNSESGATDHELSRLEVGPATGHVYQGFIYIIIGAVVGVASLIVATAFIVRLHRRKGRAFSVSGESTPTRFDDVHDYTLTRLPRTTKLYLDDIERNPWAYTNPDFQGSIPSLAAAGKKTEYLNFINTGVIPMRDRSPQLLTDSTKVTSETQKSSAKISSQSFTAFDNPPTKQKMFIDYHNHPRHAGSSNDIVRTGEPQALSPKVYITPGPGWDSSHI